MQPFEAEAERERESGRVVIKRKHQGENEMRFV
jgi:hypothetical protein